MRRMPGTPSCWWICVHTVPMDGPAEVARASSASVEGWRARGAVRVVNLVPAAARAQMLPQELAGFRRQQADVEIVPLHLDAAVRASRAARRNTRPRLRRSR